VDDIKPVSGLDIEAILAKGASSSENKRPRLEGKIGSEDPTKDFKSLIENEENSWKNGPPPIPLFLDRALMVVFTEMEVVIKDIVSRSFADSSYPKAIKALQAYRAEAIDVSPLFSKTDSVVG
jgi:hypothetical protein